ncbi:YkgJ family cysteine cluster protein [Vibrio scophthalmi]|uniref:YkgJ family cysteine cluster protein n=1 Tax=Vibrio scophthalmi TaxID=45658 RepID=UPI002284B800|nr:YkgJ family cysteine cluster protein [Vibrio scophthalmi]MCY9803061.1 YkgJ family cysteine cluster protein [Vibrio scophthalmi]
MSDNLIAVSDWFPCVSASGKGCGACCIAPSISSPIPGMPNGKPAGVRCVQLDDNNLCKIFGQPDRPKVCLAFSSDEVICYDGAEQALTILFDLEGATSSLS